MRGSADRPAPRPVDRASRVIDTVAMALVVAGGGLYMYAQYGMQQLARGRMRYQSVHGPDGGMNLAVWGDLLRLSRLGVGLAAAGVAVALVSFVRHRRTSSRAPIHEQADHS